MSDTFLTKHEWFVLREIAAAPEGCPYHQAIAQRLATRGLTAPINNLSLRPAHIITTKGREMLARHFGSGSK